MSVFRISAMAGELLNSLAAIGVIMDFPPAILGMTVLAWGNSVGDLVADVALAKSGHPTIAIAGCFAGPNVQCSVINMLVGLAIGILVKGTKNTRAAMFQAGTETAYLTLEFAMVELMRNQHMMAELQAEVRENTVPEGEELGMVTEEGISRMTYLKAVVKETLRLHPPAPFFVPRLSIADCEVDGHAIPSGTRLIINAWALGRDPGYWDRPEEFTPQRFIHGGSASIVDFKGNDFQFVPFGSGRRICPGINFAMATIEIMLANLVYHFDWELAAETGGRIDMTEVFGMSLRRKEKLHLVPRLPDNHFFSTRNALLGNPAQHTVTN